jgi:transposase-like protein
MGRAKKFPDEVMARAVRIALEGDRPIAHVAHDFGMHPVWLEQGRATDRRAAS